MADRLIRAQVTIPLDTGIPADAITNTWHFDGDDGNTDASYESATMTALRQFYGDIDGVVFPESISSPATVKLYNLRDPLPRVPFYEDTITLTPSVNRAMPHEVAICLSFQAAAVSGVSQRRRRGRIYLGPVALSVLNTDPGAPKVPALTRDAIAAAANTLRDGVAMATGSLRWATFSPTDVATVGIDNAMNDVDNGWVDDAFDTQRRRGVKATARSLFS